MSETTPPTVPQIQEAIRLALLHTQMLDLSPYNQNHMAGMWRNAAIDSLRTAKAELDLLTKHTLPRP